MTDTPKTGTDAFCDFLKVLTPDAMRQWNSASIMAVLRGQLEASGVRREAISPRLFEISQVLNDFDTRPKH